MKKNKMIATAVAVMTMAMNVMSIEASANTWSVYFYPAQAPNGLKYTDQAAFASTKEEITYFYDSCMSFQQTTNNATGSPAHVTYYAYCADNSGAIWYYCTGSNLYYYGTANNTRRTLKYSCEAYYTLVIEHDLNINGNNCSMSGNVTI